MIKDLIAYIKGSLGERLMRSSLTILSIVLGIMAIFALLSFGQGLQKYIDEIAGDFGTDKIIAQPATFGAPGSSTTNFDQKDIDVFYSENDLKVVSPSFMSQIPMTPDPDEKGKWFWIMSLPTETDQFKAWMFSYETEYGRDLKKGDKYKAMLGANHRIKDKIWDRPLEVGSKIYLNDIQFEVVGFVESVGNPQDDGNIYIPIDVAEDVFGLDEIEYNYVIMQVQEGVDIDQTVDKLERDLRRERGVKEGQEDFSITTFEEQLQVFSSVIDVINAVLAMIAGISVVVAGVNIANTMYTAVLERTKEIGVMKAIGATNWYIQVIFVIESGILGLVGGLLGVLLGYIVSKTGETIIAATGYDFLKPYFPWWLTVGCLVFAWMVGTVSGYLPSRQAAKLQPVQALRYE